VFHPPGISAPPKFPSYHLIGVFPLFGGHAPFCSRLSNCILQHLHLISMLNYRFTSSFPLFFNGVRPIHFPSGFFYRGLPRFAWPLPSSSGFSPFQNSGRVPPRFCRLSSHMPNSHTLCCFSRFVSKYLFFMKMVRRSYVPSGSL